MAAINHGQIGLPRDAFGVGFAQYHVHNERPSEKPTMGITMNASAL